MGNDEGWPAGLEARPIEKDDAAAWAELLAAKEKVDAEGENYNADDLLEELADPSLDAARDSIGVWSGEQMVAYGVVRAPDEVVDVHRVRTEGTVHPEWRGRGIGSVLVPWLNRRAAELHQERQPGAVGEINTGAIETNTSALDLLTGFGFERCRYFFSMERDLAKPVEVPPVPEGLRLVAFSPAYDETLRVAHNEVFMDHWGSSPKSPESWKTWFTGSRAFRPALAYLVMDGDEVVAYTLGYEYVADTEATGIREVYVGQVGTKRSHRGRGLAAVALAKVMAEAAADGFQRASLGVDAENPTGALGLYERLGYTTKNTWITHRLPLG
ncbi:GNAT family N-acetyltransferase [Kribbella sp. NPDC051770]|uniref:GNAT family N-acetyltransferase n=1 Tax=Kribbella sp. NPDC051770 TaxID=3155413 RepID=UPI00343AB20E